MIKLIVRLSDGTAWISIVQSNEPPVPEDEPTTGTFLTSGDVFIYVVHDDLALGYSRTLTDKIKVAMTNELFVPRRWYFNETLKEWRVDRFSKISFWPEELNYTWYSYFFSGMTQRQHELFNMRGFGWRDSGSALLASILKFLARRLNRTVLGFRPDGVAIYNFLLPGGSFLKKLGTWKEYTLFSCQDTNKPPTWVSYYDAPDKVFKQGVCGHNSLGESYYGKVNPVQGDLYVPTACPTGVATILTKHTREVRVPFKTILDGQFPVTFVRLCFRGSEVLGKTDTGEWYYIVQQVRKTGGQSDFVIHIDLADWWGVLPISTVGWQKV